METRLTFEIQPQPDDVTCGPTCLDAVYSYFGDEIPLEQVIREIPQLEGGGTLAVLLGNHALKRGYEATLYTYDLRTFDPTWFTPEAPHLAEKLKAQAAIKENAKLRIATGAYLEFLRLGGRIRMRDLNGALIRHYLERQVPILTGLSATYLYRMPREFGPKSDHDDIRGEPAGHFVVLCGYDHKTRDVMLADPLWPNPLAADHYYVQGMDRVLSAIMLGIVTYDANLLIVRPRRAGR
ncbi:C39 family peptidase [Tautonia marina]|uniref:C39 family peptidase n=1 Tax=Tautonia marina TaxID=2653855 RepID=UPI001260F8B0|nr:C39 family peptidase [Tautonia marina]